MYCIGPHGLIIYVIGLTPNVDRQCDTIPSYSNMNGPAT